MSEKVYAPAYNPSPAALHAINPNIDIPNNYLGESEDPFLAQIFALLMQRGERSLVDLTGDIDPDPAAVTGSQDRFLNLATRYLVPEQQRHMILYQFRPFLPTEPDDMGHPTNYILLLAVKYRENLLNMAPTIMRLLSSRIGSENPYLTTDEIDITIRVNSFLRAEGIVIDIDDLQRISTLWSAAEIRDILENGIKVQEAIEFTQLGIYDSAEIIANKGLISREYINSLLHPGR